MIRRLFKWGFTAGVIVAIVVAAWFIAFVSTPVSPPSTPFKFSIKSGSSLKSVARQINTSGLPITPWQFELMARLFDKGRDLKAGNYQLDASISPLDLLEKLRRGDTLQNEITFIEGQTFVQMRKILAGNAGLKPDSALLSELAVMQLIGATETRAEGFFFPDTYGFTDGMSDTAILKRAYQTMQANLAKAWEKRPPGLPYESPYQALIMASIIEKETGKAEERPRIAAVFVNRLKSGMKLQTDPTIIYSMGARFDGNIRKRDLLADTPYNTYVRSGLPPTPIAMPGLASIEAALNPASTAELYFVAKGDGSHQFSHSLQEHNSAVAKYQKLGVH